MSDLKIVSWDIETSLMQNGSFGLFNQNINYKHIIKDWVILCACWKELGKKKVHSVSIGDEGDFNDDYNVVKTLRDYLEDVDILIAHNGDKFDLKKFNARLIYHKLPPLPKIVTIDTLKQARNCAKFSSNRLDYLGEFLGVGGKMYNTQGLWIDILLNNSENSLKQMVKYCKRDVVLLEDVYLALRPYMKSHPNIAEGGSLNCPKCNSKYYTKHKTRITAQGIKKQQYQCKGCGSYFTERASSKEKSLSKV